MPAIRFENAPASTPDVVPLQANLVSIGSGHQNHIVIDESSLETNHAIIRCDGTSFRIQAASPQSTIELNGETTTQGKLNHQDKITLGEVELTFDLFAGEQSNDSSGEAVVSEEQLEAFRQLESFSEQLLSDYELSDLLDRLMDSIIEITAADKGFLILVEDDDFEIKVARNVDREDISEAVTKVSDSIIQTVIDAQEPLIVSDAAEDSQFDSSQSVVDLNLSSVMCVPLLDKGELIGLLYVGNENVIDLFTENHLELLKVFASQASLIIANALMVRDLKMDNEQLSEQLKNQRYGEMIGASDAMRDVFQTIDKVAPTDVSLLVVGETGTGKELVARETHLNSPRADNPFVTINCGAIPENLLESELFGHVEGAFTGATKTKDGKFQKADGGTILLDEIGEMPVELQVKLLRVLQEHEVTKVGANEPEQVDIRVIAATNRDLEEAVDEECFREDLYYRLNVVEIDLPPLRDRDNDAILIAKFLVNELAENLGLPKKNLSSDAIQAIQQYEWPGNIRQLENHLKQALVLSDRSIITAEDLNISPEMLSPIKPLSEAKEEFALRYIREALARNDGNRTQTAEELGVDPRTIFRYLERDSGEAQDKS
jgi:transcriptional regulator with GAF, ATPase, and Fis domain